MLQMCWFVVVVVGERRMRTSRRIARCRRHCAAIYVVYSFGREVRVKWIESLVVAAFSTSSSDGEGITCLDPQLSTAPIPLATTPTSLRAGRQNDPLVLYV